MCSKFSSQAQGCRHNYFYARRFVQKQERPRWSSSPKHNKSGQGFRKRVCNLTRLRVVERRGKISRVVEHLRTNIQGTRKVWRLLRDATVPRMAGAEGTMEAAAPLCYGKVEGERIYNRATLIHEMSCEQLGSHLYRRMCCAGRSKRSAVVGGRASGRGWWNR